MPSNNNNSKGRGQTGKNANLNIDARNGNVEDYDISEQLNKTTNAIDKLISKLDRLANSTANVGKESEKAFSTKPIKRYSDAVKRLKLDAEPHKQSMEGIENALAKIDKEKSEQKYFEDLEKKMNIFTRGKQSQTIDAMKENKKNQTDIANQINKLIGSAKFNEKTGQFQFRDEKTQQYMSYDDSAKKYEELLTSQSDYEDKALKLQEQFGEQSTNIATVGFEALKKVASTVLNEIKQDFERGVSDFHSFYESNFTEIAGRTDTGGDRSATREIFKQTQDLAKEYGSALNYNNDVLPQVMALTKQGITGDQLTARAITASVDKKILPWLEETSSTWLDVSRQMGEANTARYKNMQLTMQGNEMGNRLLQTGVIDKLTSDIYPVLESIDYNTVDRSTIPEEMLALMETYKSQGFSDQEAYQQAKNAYDIQGNMFGALTSGDVSKIVQAQNQLQYGLGEGALKTANYFTEMMGKAKDDIGASAIGSIYNASQYVKGAFMTTENARNSKLDEATYKKNYAELIAGSSNTDLYDKQKKNVDQFSTATKIFKNAIENFGSKLGRLESALPGGQMLGSAGRVALGAIGGYAGKKLLGKIAGHFLPGLGGGGGGISSLLSSLGGEGGSLLSNIGGLAKGAGGALKSAGGAVKSLGSMAKGGLSALKGASLGSAGTALLGGGLIVAGGALMAHDAVKGVKKAKDWGTSKGSAGLAGALVGAEDERSLKNTGKQALKYGAIGAGIGTFVGGPLGTVVGGAIGAGVGAIASLIPAKKLAEGLDKVKDGIKKTAEGIKDNYKNYGLIGGQLKTAKDMLFGKGKSKEEKQADKEFKQKVKLAKAEGKGEKSTVREILKSVQSIEQYFTGSISSKQSLSDKLKGKLGEAQGSLKDGLTKLAGGGISGIASVFSSLREGEGGGLFDAITTSPLTMIARKITGKNADDLESESVTEKSLTYGESQIIETIKEVGANIVKAVDAMNPTKNDIDYANGLYRAVNKGKDQSSMVTFISDSPTNSITA